MKEVFSFVRRSGWLIGICVGLVGNEGCPTRPAVEQEGVGVGDQGRAVPSEGPHLEEAERRGGRQGEAV